MEKPAPQSPSSRVIKSETPVSLIVALVFGALLFLAAIFFALTYMGQNFSAARMTGEITNKEFIEQPSEEITLGQRGEMRRRDLAGQFILTVRVPGNGGEEDRDFTVWVPEEIYNRVEIGDAFDVGPYLVPTLD